MSRRILPDVPCTPRVRPAFLRPSSGRRSFLRQSLFGMGALTLGPALSRCSGGGSGLPMLEGLPETSNLENLGGLQDPDVNGLRLPAGFTSRVVARSNETVAGTDHVWHGWPDGGATFLTEDAGYIYVSNSEAIFPGDGGVGALRFDSDGVLVDAYPILGGTWVNCAGGPTPWGTWLSCEEHDAGKVFECDPRGIDAAVEWPALGVFRHEAVAVDPMRGQLYLTEDQSDGRFYRFTPSRLNGDGTPDLSEGTLEALRIDVPSTGESGWVAIPDPSAASTPTRAQAPGTSAFDGGEGIWFHEDVVYFTTKGDNRVWAYDVVASTIDTVYDAADFADPILTGVDNLTITAAGDILVAEDGGDMQIVAVTPSGSVVPILRVVGHDASEIAGPALDPYRRRLYFSSQRGPTGSPITGAGVTYEVTGPFFV